MTSKSKIIFQLFLFFCFSSSALTCSAQVYQQYEIFVNSEFRHEFSSQPWPTPPTGPNNGVAQLEYHGITNGLWNNDLVYTPDQWFLGLDSIAQCYSSPDSNVYICDYFEINVIDSVFVGTNDFAQNSDLSNLMAQPNPFSGQTTIQFSIPNGDTYNIEIYDTLGRKIKTVFSGHLTKGEHQLEINGEEFSQGIIFCLLSNSQGQSGIVKLIRLN